MNRLHNIFSRGLINAQYMAAVGELSTKMPAWQTGFGAFSISRSGVKKVSVYIRDHGIHHQKRDVREEFILLLDKNGVDFDLDHLWK